MFVLFNKKFEAPFRFEIYDAYNAKEQPHTHTLTQTLLERPTNTKVTNFHMVTQVRGKGIKALDAKS